VSGNVLLITVEGGLVQDTVNLFGETEAIVLDWDTIDLNSSASTQEALEHIAALKYQLYPWREQVPGAWKTLLKAEIDWLDGAEHDNRLTYQRDE